jgi:hypothetical protein
VGALTPAARDPAPGSISTRLRRPFVGSPPPRAASIEATSAEEGVAGREGLRLTVSPGLEELGHHYGDASVTSVIAGQSARLTRSVEGNFLMKSHLCSPIAVGEGCLVARRSLAVQNATRGAWPVRLVAPR